MHPRVRLERHAKLLRPWWRLRFYGFGANSVLVAPRWLAGPDYIQVGRGVIIHKGAWLAAEDQGRRLPPPSLVIGDWVSIREDVVLSASEKIVIEPYVVMAGRCVVIDSTHTWDDGYPRITQNPSKTAPIRIRMGSWLCERSIVLRGTDIGAFSIVSANSVVQGHFPDFSIIAGSPARVVGSTRDRLPEGLVGLVPARAASDERLHEDRDDDGELGVAP
jgi:lipopolysaccharide O-acetyltransferase